MSCERILDKVYEQDDMSLRDMPFFDRIYVSLHLFVCPDCAEKVRRFELSAEILRDDFLPPSPELENAVMAAIAEDAEAPEADEAAAFAGGFSFRGWVVAGLGLLVSLTTIFLGMSFNNVAYAAGGSLMIPIGITVGIVLTCYGALFIASHLKRLSQRFGLESR